MSDENLVPEENILNLDPVETPDESLENLEPEDSEQQETPQEAKARKFANDRAEENRKKREALEKVPVLEAKLARLEYLKSNPAAEDYIEDIEQMVKENPTISREKAFKYVLADKNPALLAELAGETISRPDRTTLSNGEPSFSEHLGNQPKSTPADLLKAAQKEWNAITNQ